ncbi:hypothetical protein [Actinoplanes sp. NPDC020271]|uniref:hypothetical protein n=1 Tax=Actinoplanes sp. NPDC020271 TaxID=3363896 RepID=UPI0037911C91
MSAQAAPTPGPPSAQAAPTPGPPSAQAAPTPGPPSAQAAPTPGPPSAQAAPTPGPPTTPASKSFARPTKRPAPGGGNPEDREVERGLRGLVGSGSSQVSVGAALRARDACRPTEDDLAAAERDLVIVRRNWLPREDLPRR